MRYELSPMRYSLDNVSQFVIVILILVLFGAHMAKKVAVNSKSNLFKVVALVALGAIAVYTASYLQRSKSMNASSSAAELLYANECSPQGATRRVRCVITNKPLRYGYKYSTCGWRETSTGVRYLQWMPYGKCI